MPSKKNRKYIGSWSETTSSKIDLPFEIDCLIKVLQIGSCSEREFSHQQIAHWCYSFFLNFSHDNDTILALLKDVASDVDAQWEMYLSNTYELEQLQSLDFSKVSLPLEWFGDWISQITHNKTLESVIANAHKIDSH